MGKAAIGVVGNVQHWGTEAQTVQLAYPEKDLNQTAVAEALDMGRDAQNVLLAIVCSPNTMEDSYLVNAAAVERGLRAQPMAVEAAALPHHHSSFAPAIFRAA